MGLPIFEFRTLGLLNQCKKNRKKIYFRKNSNIGICSDRFVNVYYL